MIVCGKNLVEPFLRASILCIRRLGRDAIPKLIDLREARLDVPAREQVVDIGPCAAVVTGVN